VSTAAPKWASDGNEPESNDTITRGATAVSNQIKSSPSQSRMAVHDHTSIDDVVCECEMLFEVKMCCNKCEDKVREEVLDVHGVADVKVDRSASKVAVFGKAEQSRVLKKLKKFDKRAKAISVDKKKLQQGPVGPESEEQEYPLRSSYYYEILQQSEGCVQGKYAPYLRGPLVMGVPAIQPHNSNGQRDTSASSLTSSSNEPAPTSEEHPSLQQLRDGSDPSTVGALVGTTTTQDFFTQALHRCFSYSME
jgi:copper chaperone CopZ